ncbi:origin recognition complex subunit 1 isoform X2 [Ambystoma mexicanum]|uniref:origin recognition complex subunit 1 isoform X2 n=1 Tax=Ambystoma mexicanum TaxID=8296 RepID=UPI0037E93F92
MSKYFTRIRRRRCYSWAGAGWVQDRKLHTKHYGGIIISSEENLKGTHISNGDFILVQGDDPDRPFVAKLLELYDEGARNGAANHSRKHAVVQWYARFEEVPRTKQKRLGRAVHPQEIFLYDVPACDNDIDAETIVGTVQVNLLHSNANIPVEKADEKEFFVKLSWNGKAFQPLACALTPDGKEKGPKTAGIGPVSQLMPPPYSEDNKEGDVDILCALAVESNRISRSAAKTKEVGIESKHSASKYSHSKDRNAQRVTSGLGTPGARKKLQLSSPTKSPGSKLNKQDILDQLFDEDDVTFLTLEPEIIKRKVAFSGLSDSPKKLRCDSDGMLGSTLRPLKTSKDLHVEKGIRLTPARLSKDCNHSPKTKMRTNGTATSPLEPKESSNMMEGKTNRSSKTPQKQSATPRSSTTPLKRETPSRRCSVLSAKKPDVEELKEQQEESGKTADTPRSRRKSALISSHRSRQQLRFLGGDFGNDDEDFQPILEAVESSTSEDEDCENDQEEHSKPVAASRKKSSSAPRTPVPSKKPSLRTPAKTPSKSPAPRTPRLATPRIPERNKPARNPSNVLEEARLRLHVSAVPESLPCREQEYQDIYNFVESKLLDGTGGCMYISGVPGTGKTATVHEVIRCLQTAAENDDVPNFQYIEINGMKLTDPHQAYVQILKLLTGQKATADHAGALLEKRFSTPAPKRETTVLMVDELDLLWTRKQNVMYNLFDWPTRKQAKLIVLAIANTMDLPERIMINRVASRLGLTRMSFQPYAFKQLQQIITSRLNHVKAFKDDAIQLVARKVAALSGDARRCLDICRRATEICEFSGKNSASLVGMEHVMEALEEMFSSPYVIAIRNSSVLEQGFLRAVLSEFRRSGLEEALFQQVYHQLIALCRLEGLQPPTMSETMAVCLRLGACRLLLVEPSRNDLLLRVRLNVSQDDVMYALKVE